MKRLARLGLCLLALGLSGAAHAGPIFEDPFGTGAPDVLGDASLYDIRSLEIVSLAPGDVRIAIRMNYNGGDPTLATFSVPGGSFALAPLTAGDILFEGRDHLWAIPLTGGIGGPPGGYLTAGAVAVGEPTPRAVVPGGLYRVDAFLRAADVLGVAPSGDFRADAPVWGVTPSYSPESFGYFTTTAVGGSELEIQLVILAGQAFLDDLADGYRLRFASTTCACDVLDVSVPAAVPEGGAGALLALAVGLLGARRLRDQAPRNARPSESERASRA